MKIAENYKEIISLWEKDYKSMLGKWITDYTKNEFGTCPHYTYAFRARCSIFNAIILLEEKDWDNAISIITKFKRGKNKSECLRHWYELKNEYANQLARDQNCITLGFGKYIQSTWRCYFHKLQTDVGWYRNLKNQDQINSAINRLREENGFDFLRAVEDELITPMNAYFLCKKELEESERVMNFVRSEISNGSSLKEVADSMKNIQKSSKEISKELVNT